MNFIYMYIYIYVHMTKSNALPLNLYAVAFTFSSQGYYNHWQSSKKHIWYTKHAREVKKLT